MRDKALKKKLQQLHIPQYDEYKLEKVIVEAKKIDLFSGNQRMTNTEFFLNQLGFISNPHSSVPLMTGVFSYLRLPSCN